MIPEITFTTPALLFPAISLLLVAYTNRFNVITSRIRSMSTIYKTTPDVKLKEQMKSLRKRVLLIRNMQGFGIGGLFLCVLCIFALFAGEIYIAKLVFGISLIFMLISLAYSLAEVFMSVQALNLELSDLDS